MRARPLELFSKQDLVPMKSQYALSDLEMLSRLPLRLPDATLRYEEILVSMLADWQEVEPILITCTTSLTALKALHIGDL